MGLIGTSWGFHGNFMGPRGEKRDLVKKICLENQALDDQKSWTRNLWRGQDTAMIHIIRTYGVFEPF